MKLKIVLAAAVILIGQSLKAQTETKVRKRNVALGLSLFGGTGKIFYRNPDQYLVAKPDIFNFDKKKTNNDLRIGIDVKIDLTEQFGLSTGCLFIRERNFWYYQYDNNPLITARDIYRRIGLPIRFDFRFTKKHLAPFLSLGAMPVYRLRQTQMHSSEYNGLVVSTKDFIVESDKSRIEVPFQIGCGLDVRLEKLRLQVFPLYEFAFEHDGYNSFNHTLGLALSLSYRL